jgi:aryl-alcohol dehydrogenase-like predicted oxidoreductase
MKKVQLGKSDLFVSPIVFGAWAIGGLAWGGSDDDDAMKAMRHSLDLGITSIDTAPIYGLGHSEKIVGDFVKEVGRDKVEILTKFGLNWKTKKGEHLFDVDVSESEKQPVRSYAGKDGIIQELEDSLRRLKTDYIDLYQIHRPDAGTEIEETMGVLEDLMKEGKIRAIGVSNHSVSLMKRSEKIVELASSQSPYSMIYRKIEKDIVPHCLIKDIGILAYSPLQRGILTGKITPDYKFRDDDHRPTTKWFKEPNITRTNELLDKIKPIAASHNKTLGQVVLNWTLQRPGISALLVGARNAKQASENAACLDFDLFEEDIRFIDAEMKKVVIEG